MIYCFIFFIVVFVSFYLAWQGARLIPKGKLKFNLPITLCCLIIILFIGFRYNVGRDYPSHWLDYRYLDYDDFGYLNRYQLEYGYLYIVKLAKILPFGAQGIFLISSVIMTLLLFNLYKASPKLLACGLFCFFFCGPYDFEINGLRQGIAILAFLNGCSYLKESVPVKKSLVGYILWISFGTLFHTSCAPLLLVYPIRFLNIDNRWIGFAIILAPVLGYLINISGITGSFFNLGGLEFESSNYNSYLSDEKSDYLKVAADGLNVGQFAIFFFSMIPLYYYKRIIKEDADIKVYVLLYSIGLTISSMFIGNMMVTRIAYYFTFALLLVYPAYARSVKNKKFSLRSMPLITGMFYLFWAWFFVQFFYTLPRFFELQVWPEASLFGISI